MPFIHRSAPLIYQGTFPLTFRSFFYYQIYGTVERCKYYALWTLTEGASILTGLGFSGFAIPTSPAGKNKQPVPQWNGAANVIVSGIEFPSNFKVLLDSWNMKTNVWLRECVYKRVAPAGKRPGTSATILTYITSALWVSHKPFSLSLSLLFLLMCDYSTVSPQVTISPLSWVPSSPQQPVSPVNPFDPSSYPRPPMLRTNPFTIS